MNTLQPMTREDFVSGTQGATESNRGNDASYEQFSNLLEQERIGAPPALPDLSNRAWMSDPAGTKTALIEYARTVVEGAGSPTDKYQTLRNNLPDDLFSGTRLGWLNEALSSTNASAASALVRAIDPYRSSIWFDPENGSRMNSLAAASNPDAVQLGYDNTGSYYDENSASDVSPGELRDISDELAASMVGRIFAGGADVAENERTSPQAQQSMAANLARNLARLEGATLQALSDVIDDYT